MTRYIYMIIPFWEDYKFPSRNSNSDLFANIHWIWSSFRLVKIQNLPWQLTSYLITNTIHKDQWKLLGAWTLTCNYRSEQFMSKFNLLHMVVWLPLAYSQYVRHLFSGIYLSLKCSKSWGSFQTRKRP